MIKVSKKTFNYILNETSLTGNHRISLMLNHHDLDFDLTTGRYRQKENH